MTLPPPTPLPVAEFVYVGDPMCSWCWGFAPVLEAAAVYYALPIRVVVGGLRPGPAAEVLDDRMRRFLAHHWDQVAARTGQPFDHAALDREGWVYDTELPARAVTTMRRLAPHRTLEFFTRLQRAFYAEAIDITDPENYPALSAEFPVDPDEFMARLRSDTSTASARKDFAEARRLAIQGFPALLLRLDDEHVTVARGYVPWGQLEPELSGWLRRRFGTTQIVPSSRDAEG